MLKTKIFMYIAKRLCYWYLENKLWLKKIYLNVVYINSSLFSVLVIPIKIREYFLSYRAQKYLKITANTCEQNK